MKEVLASKEKMIENLNADNGREKNRVVSLTREYEGDITQLAQEKSKLVQEIEVLLQENERLSRDRAVLGDELGAENERLRDLLFESSGELERCREELMGLAKDNARLVSRVKSA